jgi:hypothetical protein
MILAEGSWFSYGKGLQLDETLIDEAVRRTRGVSAAFIKELMRRTAQAGIGRGWWRDNRVSRSRRSAR